MEFRIPELIEEEGVQPKVDEELGTEQFEG
jgi:hypothetical protein